MDLNNSNTSIAGINTNTEGNTAFLKRGDIVKVNNPISEGTDTNRMAGIHYAVVVSNNKGNINSNTVIVVYATGGASRLDLPCNYPIRHYGSLPEPVGTILGNQITTLDQKNIISVIDHLRPEDEIGFNRALKASLALEEY